MLELDEDAWERRGWVQSAERCGRCTEQVVRVRVYVEALDGTKRASIRERADGGLHANTTQAGAGNGGFVRKERAEEGLLAATLAVLLTFREYGIVGQREDCGCAVEHLVEDRDVEVASRPAVPLG